MTSRSILAMLALVAGTGGAAAQQLNLAESDWSVGCNADSCTLSRSLLAKEGSQRFSTISFSVSATAESIPMAIFVPLGTAVQQPLVLQGGSAQQEYPFTTCLSEGCLVLTQIGVDDLQNFTVLPSLNLSFYAAEANTPVSVDFPLGGMAEAMDQVAAQLQK